jgi:hypothetical protein
MALPSDFAATGNEDGQRAQENAEHAEISEHAEELIENCSAFWRFPLFPRVPRLILPPLQAFPFIVHNFDI